MKIDNPKVEHKDVSFEIKEVTDSGKFTGYGSIFGELDFGGDIVAAGAFADSLAETKKKNRKIPALWQHKSSEPIGVYDDISEDSQGLWVEGRLLVNEVQKAKEAHALMREGAVTGLSIGYGTKEYSMNTDTWERTLIKVDLYEVSPVTFPMLDSARIDAVKNKIMAGNLPSMKEFEEFLRESGFSKTQATAIAGKGLKGMLRSESVTSDQAKDLTEILSSFKIPNF